MSLNLYTLQEESLQGPRGARDLWGRSVPLPTIPCTQDAQASKLSLYVIHPPLLCPNVQGVLIISGLQWAMQVPAVCRFCREYPH